MILAEKYIPAKLKRIVTTLFPRASEQHPTIAVEKPLPEDDPFAAQQVVILVNMLEDMKESGQTTVDAQGNHSVPSVKGMIPENPPKGT